MTAHEHRSESREICRALVRRLEGPLALESRPDQRLAAGATLLLAGTPVTRLPLIRQGRIDSLLHLVGADGGRVLPVSWGPGEIALLSQLFADRPSFVELVAGSDLVVRWVPVSEIEAALLREEDLLVLVVRFLAQRLREVHLRERAWVERGVHERVCATLERLARQAPHDESGHPMIIATHEELAERSGVSRPKLSQELKRLELAGHLRLERKAIRIIDLRGIFEPAD